MKEVKNIYNLESVSEDLYEYVGRRVVEYKELMDNATSLPQILVLTSVAFDTFLVENELVDDILEQLSQVELKQRFAGKIAKKIRKQILEASIPNSIKNELKTYYKKLAGLGQAPLRVFPSPLEVELEESMVIRGVESSFSFGFDDFLNDIKSNWADMFTEQALIYRESVKYEGSLSMGLVIMKSPIAEVSAVVTTQNPLLQSNQIEVSAILGTVEPFLRGELVGDRYVCNIQTDEIIEKSVIEQKWMAVYKLAKKRYQEHKLKISNVWKSRQKLSDKNIQKVVEYTKQLKELINYPFEAVFQLELGKIILVEVRKVTVVTAVAEPGSNLDSLRKKIESEAENSVEVEDELENEKMKEEDLAKEDNDLELESELQTVDLDAEIKAPETPASEKEEKLPEVDISKIDPEKEIKTVIDVVGTDWNLPDYVKFHKNIDLLINRSGNEFFASESRSVESLIKYLESVLTHAHESVVYQLSSDVKNHELELEGIRKVRNNKKLKNLWVSVSNVKNAEEYLEVKKKISLAKLRRSSTFKVLAVVDNAASAMIVGDIIEASADGLIYNLDQILQNTLGTYSSDKVPIEGVKEILRISLKMASDHKMNTYVIGDSLDKYFDIQEIIKMGATGIGTKLADTLKTKERVKKISKI